MRNVVSLPVAAAVSASTLLIGLAAGVMAANPMQLVVYKNSIPTDARNWNGRLYVPIADVAKVMQWRLTVGGGKITLEPIKPASAPPATPRLVGVVDDELFTGKYRFRINSIHEASRYDRKYANGLTDASPVTANDGEKLVVADCVLTNATAQPDEFCFSRDRWAENTALIDINGVSVQPTGYDVAADEVNPTGARVGVGEQVHFALVFRVSTAWKSRALNYTIVRYEERGLDHGATLRINLAP